MTKFIFDEKKIFSNDDDELEIQNPAQESFKMIKSQF